MFEVSLSTDRIASRWGCSSALSYHETGALIHIQKHSDTTNILQSIQRSARTLAATGISSFRLLGQWSMEAQLHFWQGAYDPKNAPLIEYAELNAQDLEKLTNTVRVHSWVRNLINKTPQELSPQTLADAVVEFLVSLSPDNVTYKTISAEELETLGYVGLYAVGCGSERPPVLLQLDFCPAGCEGSPPVASLVGKGVTFDSGGYSLKQTLNMLHMKSDMGGAATVAGALGLAILNGLNRRVKLYLCCAENLVSGRAYKLADVLKYRNGVSVEVVNTDAEGRLLLADGLIDASQDGSRLLIDAATLTGAAKVALGNDYNALFCMDDDLARRYESFCTREQDACWRLPLTWQHRTRLPSNYAHTANSRPVPGGGPGGASNAAGFLSRFVSNPEKGWLHLDLAACFMTEANALWSAGATGRGIRGVAALLLSED